jgi:hypothetical protein
MTTLLLTLAALHLLAFALVLGLARWDRQLVDDAGLPIAGDWREAVVPAELAATAPHAAALR